MDLSNQIVTEKIENGYLVTMKVKNEMSNILDGVFNKSGFLKDKKQYIAKDEKELLELYKKLITSLKNHKEVEELIDLEKKQLELKKIN